MCRFSRTAVSLLLCLSFFLPLFPSSPAAGTTLELFSESDFLRFGESCRSDAYSRRLRVLLRADLDFRGDPVPSVPYFAGSFDGGGHVVSGFALDATGSVEGLFRYLAPGSVVENLTVKGRLEPKGSRGKLGGIAGVSAGTLRNCHFDGFLSGGDGVGGIAGSNRVPGIVEECTVSGTVVGTHFIGGLVGENSGVIRSCRNSASVNTEARDKRIPLSELSMDSFTGSESVETVTDVGGIAGNNSGVIRSCVNEGAVGYPHVGYNVGGVAGTHNGYMLDCSNRATVHGRKEVGGVVGQLEPVLQVRFRADTIQLLQAELGKTSDIMAETSSNAGSLSSSLTSGLNDLREQGGVATDALQQLLPESGEMPDEDTITAARSALSGSLTKMGTTMDSIVSSAESGSTALSGNFSALSDQVNSISRVLGSASDHVGGSIHDVSDQDTSRDTTGKIAGCENFGGVSGDLNVGGIVGSIDWENNLDHEDDFQVAGSESLNMRGDIRAVVRDCANHDTVSARKLNVGGIVGRARAGLVKDSSNSGDIRAENATHVGGVVGGSTGTIRSCCAKCALSGKTEVGGIAGIATLCTDSVAAVKIDACLERGGSLLGVFDGDIFNPEDALRRNVYLPLFRDYGGIDGISYAGMAEGLAEEAFLSRKNLPPLFSASTVTFMDDDLVLKEERVPFGSVLDEGLFPERPPRSGGRTDWAGLELLKGGKVYLDTALTVQFIPDTAVIESVGRLPDGRPRMLLEGAFRNRKDFRVFPLREENFPVLRETELFLEGWQLPVLPGETVSRYRVALPGDIDSRNTLRLTVLRKGVWERRSFVIEGDYYAADAEPGDSAILLLGEPDYMKDLYRIASLFGALTVAAVFSAVRRRIRTSGDSAGGGKEGSSPV